MTAGNMGGKRTVLLVYGGFRLFDRYRRSVCFDWLPAVSELQRKKQGLLYLLYAVWIYGIRSQSAGGVFCLFMAADCNTGFDIIGGTGQESDSCLGCLSVSALILRCGYQCHRSGQFEKKPGHHGGG